MERNKYESWVVGRYELAHCTFGLDCDVSTHSSLIQQDNSQAAIMAEAVRPFFIFRSIGQFCFSWTEALVNDIHYNVRLLRLDSINYHSLKLVDNSVTRAFTPH